MVYKFIVGILNTNCYIYVDDDSKEAVVIDPGGEINEIIKFIKDNKIIVKYIILTHGHFDHIFGVQDLKQNLNCKILMPLNDKDFIKDKSKNMCFEGINLKEFQPDSYIKGNDKIYVGQTVFDVLDTPGHTEGGISLYTKNIVFTGDTLFNKTVGRTDLYGGDEELLWASIKNNLFTLPEDTIVYPGHGRQTIIKDEK